MEAPVLKPLGQSRAALEVKKVVAALVETGKVTITGNVAKKPRASIKKPPTERGDD